MPYRQLLLAVEIEMAVLVKSFFEDIPSKKRRRALLRRLKRNTRKHLKDKARIGPDEQAATEIARARLQSHITELQSRLP